MYQGKLVTLRALEQNDLNDTHRFVNDYETMRGAMSGMLYPSSHEDEARWASGQSSFTHGEYQFAIETTESGILIGRCGFIRIDWKNRLGELAILIGEKSFRGKGYGTDALQVLTRFGFSELNLRKLKVSVMDFNLPALRAYEKCGFTREGVLRQEIYREGSYHDVIQMALFAPGQAQ